eukprot:5873913-Alexandrium_andersonii.AAC.1
MPPLRVEGKVVPIHLQEVAQRLLLHAVCRHQRALRAREPARVGRRVQAGLEGRTDPLMVSGTWRDHSIRGHCEQLR